MSRRHQTAWDVLAVAQRSLTAEPAATARRRLEDVIEAHEADGLFIPCRFGDPQATARWTSSDPDVQDEAAALCQECPALAECQGFALRFPWEAGVYGGFTEHDRRRMQKRSRAVAS